MSEQDIQRALANKEYARAKRLARESVEAPPTSGTKTGGDSFSQAQPAPPVASHDEDCPCDRCEDQRRMALGLLPKREEDYPDFIVRRKRFFQGTKVPSVAEQQRISSALYLGKKP